MLRCSSRQSAVGSWQLDFPHSFKVIRFKVQKEVISKESGIRLRNLTWEVLLIIDEISHTPESELRPTFGWFEMTYLLYPKTTHIEP